MPSVPARTPRSPPARRSWGVRREGYRILGVEGGHARGVPALERLHEPAVDLVHLGATLGHHRLRHHTTPLRVDMSAITPCSNAGVGRRHTRSAVRPDCPCRDWLVT